MGRAKEQLIEATDGFNLLEALDPSLFHKRVRAIQQLERKILSGIPFEEREVLLAQLRALKGIPSPEWDYEDHND